MRGRDSTCDDACRHRRDPAGALTGSLEFTVTRSDRPRWLKEEQWASSPDSKAMNKWFFCSDPDSGLRAIVAIYSTALGPALGGTRFYPYATEQDALQDVLNLSRAMAYKSGMRRPRSGRR